jgi:hypothetical protein
MMSIINFFAITIFLTMTPSLLVVFFLYQLIQIKFLIAHFIRLAH